MKKLLTIALFVLPFCSFGDTVRVNGVRMWPAPDKTRLVFDVSGPAEYSLFDLENPPRVVIDIHNARMGKSPPQPRRQDSLLGRIRTGTRNGHDLRVVLDLHNKSSYKTFLLKPNRKYGYRLVVDLHQLVSRHQRVVKKSSGERRGLRDLVIAIDAGHGGEDPGAQGYSGVYEKRVVLAIARKLAVLVDRQRGMRPVMIRKGDYYVSLRERTRLARKYQADFYISIHADSFRDRRVRGMSVYALSRNGASDEAARWLAEKENASDLIGGVSLDDKDDLLASVLLDLSQTATREASQEVAGKVLDNLKRVGRLHKRQVQHAGFVVLKSPDIPSILVETAFISNPHEENNLRNKRHQTQLAKAMFNGILEYFAFRAPFGMHVAKEYVISPGDTLSAIAQRYGVSLKKLRVQNSLKGSEIRAGQVLKIPHGS